MGLTRDQKIKLNATNIDTVKDLVYEIDRKHTKELRKRDIEKSWILTTIGGAIIIFDFVKDYLSEAGNLRYKVGFGWQQWLLLGIGFFLVAWGLIIRARKPDENEVAH